MASHNVNFANATLEGALGGLQLQNHAAGDDARVHEMVDLFAGNGREDFVAIEDAGDIGEVHEVVRIDELSTGRSHVIGIDVVELAVRAQPEARGNRGKLLPPERFEKAHIDAGQIAHIAEAALDVVMHERCGGETGRVRRGDADSGLAFCGNRGGKPFIKQPGEYHYSDIAGFAIGDAQSGDKFAFNPETLEGGGEETATAMNHQDFVAMPRERGDVLRELLHGGGIFEQSAREFDDNPHKSPVCSSRPSVRFMFCTACPAAPFPKLSRHETIMRRFPSVSRTKPISQKFVFVTCCNSGNEPAGEMRTMWRPA